VSGGLPGRASLRLDSWDHRLMGLEPLSGGVSNAGALVEYFGNGRWRQLVT
jgi:hypothetical protein